MCRMRERATELGKLGHALSLVIGSTPEGFPEATTDQWAYVTRASANATTLRPEALSMLCCNAPLQIECTSEKIDKLIDMFNICQEIVAPRDNEISGDYNTMLQVLADPTRSKKELKDLNIFPVVKSYGEALVKTNIFAESALLGVVETLGPAVGRMFARWFYLLRGMPNDSVAAAILYAAGAYSCLGVRAMPIAVASILYPSEVKCLNVIVKSLGWNSTRKGSMLCELNVLGGRGIGHVDTSSDSFERCTQKWVDENCVYYEQTRLRECIREVYREELGNNNLKLEPIDAMLGRRWAWFVNGAHSPGNEELATGIKSRARALPFARVHRRVVAENYSAKELGEWRGDVIASRAVKLELSKGRLLLACDTWSYIAFEHILSSVERVWAGRYAILNPGNYGYVGMHNRLESATHSAPYRVMLDYDDFNAQHSNESMESVFAVLNEWFNDDDITKAATSFHRTYVSINGKKERLLGGLCSGHRATTFVNTILNRAYLKYVVKDFNSVRAMHVGDDIFLSVGDAARAAAVIDDIIAHPIRMNPVKQSVGVYTGEFLRVAYGREAAYGYYARAVGSIVSGNWVTERETTAVESISAFASSAWGAVNRSGSLAVGEIIGRCVARRKALPTTMAIQVCTGSSAVGDGPVRDTARNPMRYDVITGSKALELHSKIRATNVNKRFRNNKAQMYWFPEEFGVNDTVLRAKKDFPPWLGALATEEYLLEHVSPVEAAALVMSGGDVRSRMLESSYSKSMACVDETRDYCIAMDHWRNIATEPGAAEVHALAREVVGTSGCLKAYPLVMLFKNSLSSAQIARLVYLHTGQWVREADAHLIAFGGHARGCVVQRGIPFADAYRLGQRTNKTYLTSKYDIYV